MYVLGLFADSPSVIAALLHGNPSPQRLENYCALSLINWEEKVW